MSSSYELGEWQSASTEGTLSPVMPSIPATRRATRASRHQQQAASSSCTSDPSSEPAGPAGEEELDAVLSFINGDESYKRRPRERVVAPTHDTDGRPIPDDELKKERRRITNRLSARRMRVKRQQSNKQLRSGVQHLYNHNRDVEQQLEQTRRHCEELKEEIASVVRQHNSALQENKRMRASLECSSHPYLAGHAPTAFESTDSTPEDPSVQAETPSRRTRRHSPEATSQLQALPDLSLPELPMEQLVVASPPQGLEQDASRFMAEVAAMAFVPAMAPPQHPPYPIPGGHGGLGLGPHQRIPQIPLMLPPGLPPGLPQDPLHFLSMDLPLMSSQLGMPYHEPSPYHALHL